MHQIVFASGNQGKLAEFATALLEYELISQVELGIDPVIENGKTFLENALIKARNATKCSAFPSIADDSGLVIPELDGAPGIYSARYAGEHATDKDNLKLVLKHMQGKKVRTAYFYAAVVYMRYPDDPVPLIATGYWQGVLLDAPKGEGGFGYDPIFYLPQLGKTSAQLSIAEKNKYSHRGQAINQLVAQIKSSLLCKIL